MRKPVDGLVGYEIEDDGTVWACRRRKVPVAMKPQKSSDGYAFVNLVRPDGTRHPFKIHHLVLEAFVGPRPAGMDACHNDGNRMNPRLENLRWATRKENLADMRKHGTLLTGERNPHSKLLSADVADIRRRKASGERSVLIAADYGIHPYYVDALARGRDRKHDGGYEQ